MAPAVYIYELPEALTGRWLYVNMTHDRHDFQWAAELEFSRRMDLEFPLHHRAKPSEADILYIPVLMVKLSAI